MFLEVINTVGLSAQKIMDYDKKLLKSLVDKRGCILHLYEWVRPSITCGYFVDSKKILNLENIEKRGIEVAKRPTGGGVVFHMWDMAFSFLMSSSCNKFYFNTLKNYEFVNSCVLKVVEEFLKFKNEGIELISYDMPSDSYLRNFCMGRPTKYDVLIKNKKVAGAAQRRTKNGYLHQGTIALVMPQEEILESLLLQPEAVRSIFSYTFPLLGDQGFKDVLDVKNKLKDLLIKYFEKTLF